MIWKDYISTILAALVAISLFTTSTVAFTGTSTGAVPNAPFDHELTDANNSSVSVDSDSGFLVLAPAANQTVRGETTFEPGTELQVQIHATSQFFKSQTVTVQSDRSFNATFNFTDYAPGTEFGVIVSLPGNNSTDSKPLTTVDGALRNSSGAATTTLSTTALSTATDTTTETTTETAGDVPVEESTTETTASDSGGQPGFGVAVALVALAGFALLAVRLTAGS